MKTLKKTQAESSADRELLVSRVIDAPVARVWKAWTDPEELARWWGPYGFSGKTHERTFAPGGRWRHTMVGPDGVEYPNLSRYEEIVPLERIVYAHGGGTKGRAGVSFQQTVTFKDLGNGKTEIVLRGVFATKAARDQAVKDYGAVEGGRQTLARLAALCEGGFVFSRLVAAGRDRVWKAWTDPRELARWFGPKGFETVKADLDFRADGSYHYGIKGPDGKTMWGLWRFREIAAPSKLVFVQSFSDEKRGLTRHPMAPVWPLENLSTIEFQEFGLKTLVTVSWTPLNATEIERKTFVDARPSMVGGWTGTFERLDAFLKEAA